MFSENRNSIGKAFLSLVSFQYKLKQLWNDSFSSALNSLNGTGNLNPATDREKEENHVFVIQKVQPALLGLMDGSVSTLAPLFATAGLTGKPMEAFMWALQLRWVQGEDFH